jgi:hypothetical protein
MMNQSMKKLGAVLFVLIFGAGALFASDSANQTVTYEVTAINEISTSGNPGALTVSAATAGSQPDEVSDAATTYAITTNGTSKKITGILDTAMPTGMTLKVDLIAPTGGTNIPDVTLTAVAADLVTGITQVAESGKAITYKLSATVAAGVVTSANKTVTLTIADGI